MHKFRNVLFAAGVACVWIGALVYANAPQLLRDVWVAVSDAPFKDEGVYTIENWIIPLDSPSASEGIVSENGWLQVRDGKLLNQYGAPIQLKGMSSHGLAWYANYASKAAILTTRGYGANLFRAAMYVDGDAVHYSSNAYDRKKSRAALCAVIDDTLALDMYAIADWHLLKDENPLVRVDAAVDFFGELSEKYAGEAGVIYEICNEPNGQTTWEDICEYAENVIPAIRSHSPDAIIIVGTPEYSSSLAPAIERPLPYDNVLYAYHYYSGLSTDSYVYTLDSAMAAQLPVFVSEWGVGGGENPYNLEEQHAVHFLAYLSDHGIGWANWSLTNKDEPFSAIRADCTKLDGWKEEDLSRSGQIVFDAFGAE